MNSDLTGFLAKGGKKLIVASGVAFTHTEDALRMLETDEVALLKIASVYPLPRSLVREALSNRETVLVVEEGAPFVELQLRALATIAVNSNIIT